MIKANLNTCMCEPLERTTAFRPEPKFRQRSKNVPDETRRKLLEEWLVMAEKEGRCVAARKLGYSDVIFYQWARKLNVKVPRQPSGPKKRALAQQLSSHCPVAV